MPFDEFPRADDDVPKSEHELPDEESVEEHSMEEFPEGFEHFRFRAKPEVAEALRELIGQPDD